VFAAVVTIGAAACDRGRDAAAEIDPELQRELELALQGDTTPAVFGDTAVSVADPPAEAVREVVTPPPAEARVRSPRPAPVQPVTSVKEEITTEVAEVTEVPEPVFRTLTVPTGTTIDLALDVELSTETNEPGDQFTATVQQPIHDPDGRLVIPAGASVRGRVTHVQKSGRVGETALLNLAIEAVSWDDARYPLEATVVQANPERVSRSTTSEQVGKVAAGAAAGAILGRVLGGKNKDAIKGAVVGAAAGTAIALGTADVDAVLKKGSLMVIRTERPLEVVVQAR
jgi:hypothetical protein